MYEIYELRLDHYIEDQGDRHPLDEPIEVRVADTAAKRLNALIFDINPAEICTHIQNDNLNEWCVFMQTEMKIAMVQLLCWAKEER